MKRVRKTRKMKEAEAMEKPTERTRRLAGELNRMRLPKFGAGYTYVRCV